MQLALAILTTLMLSLVKPLSYVSSSSLLLLLLLLLTEGLEC